MALQGPTRQLPGVVVLPRLFEMTVLTCPTSPAVKDARQNVWLSYCHLNQRANALARYYKYINVLFEIFYLFILSLSFCLSFSRTHIPHSWALIIHAVIEQRPV